MSFGISLLRLTIVDWKLATIVHEKWDSISASESASAEGKKPTKAKKKAAISADPKLKKALDKVFDGGKAVDVALFGRMLADMPEKNQNAACQVAHAISTHAVEREFDFYTAVDDLKPEDTAGADMMGTVEFNSACFYRYAVVDWEKLKLNLQADTDLATKGLRTFMEGFVVAEPTGKQNTFAAHNPTEFVAVSVRRNAAPRNLANAFETAIRVRADAAFLVGLECGDLSLLEGVHTALRDPVWPLALGRKSYVPSESIWMKDGLQDTPLNNALAQWPWIVSPQVWEELPKELLVSFESEDGSGILRLDQPLSSFSERRFGARYVRTEWISFSQAVGHVSA